MRWQKNRGGRASAARGSSDREAVIAVAGAYQTRQLWLRIFQQTRHRHAGRVRQRPQARDHAAQRLEIAERTLAFQFDQDPRHAASLGQVSEFYQWGRSIVRPDQTRCRRRCCDCLIRHDISLTMLRAALRRIRRLARGKCALTRSYRGEAAARAQATGMARLRLIGLSTTLVVKRFTFGFSAISCVMRES